MNLGLKVKIVRDARVQTYPFTDYFRGFEKVETVKRIFGDKVEVILQNLKVEFNSLRWGYMGVSDVDGHIFVNVHYLKNGDTIDLYLDVIHELVHVKQFMEGKELFESGYDYVERPTEIEAHRHAVEEAKRLGLNDNRICQYLRTEWMTDDDFKKLSRTLSISCE